MKTRKQLIKHPFMLGSLVIVATLLLSACSILSPAAPTPDPLAEQATIDAAVVQAMQTFAADMTSTAAAIPTSTFTLVPTLEPTATFTPEPTATLAPPPTNTWVPYTPVPTATATPSAYSCKLVSVSPSDGAKINPNVDFDGVWTVKNVGTQRWEVGLLDLRYMSGTKFQTKGDIFDVSKEVATGTELVLVVDMKSPSTAGKYTASWILTMDGTNALCTLPLNIEVVSP